MKTAIQNARNRNRQRESEKRRENDKKGGRVMRMVL